MLALDSTRLLHINEIEWSEKKAKIFGKLCAAPKMKSQNQQLCFLYWCFEWHKKNPKIQSRFCRRNRKSKPKKSFKTTIRKESVVRFYGKSAANLKSISKVSRIIPNIRYEKHLSGTATVWMVFNWKRIYRYQKFKQKTHNKKRTDSIPF